MKWLRYLSGAFEWNPRTRANDYFPAGQVVLSGDERAARHVGEGLAEIVDMPLPELAEGHDEDQLGRPPPVRSSPERPGRRTGNR